MDVKYLSSQAVRVRVVSTHATGGGTGEHELGRKYYIPCACHRIIDIKNGGHHNLPPFVTAEGE